MCVCTGKSGEYLDNCAPSKAADFAADPDNAKRLWQLSSKMVCKHLMYVVLTNDCIAG